MKFVILLIMLAPCLAAQEEEAHVVIQALPENPVVGSIWTLTLLIDHDDPNEVDVLAPSFTGPLLLEQVSKGPRYINTSKAWTVVEYRYKANSPGTFSFDTFTVITPDTELKIDLIEVTVRQSPTAAQITTKQIYRLAWEGLPSGLGIGESAVFNLRVNGWNSTPSQLAAFIPETGLFLPTVPPGHILESLPLSWEDRSAGMALKLRLVPLELVPFRIEGRLLSPKAVNGMEVAFEIPSLSIPIRQAQRSPPTAPETNVLAQEENTPIPFPPLEAAAAEHPAIYKKYATECKTVYANAKDLWEKAQFAESLAKLRQNERDHSAGKLFVEIRRGAEQSLGLFGMHDERRDLLMKLWLFTGRYRSAVLKDTTIRNIPDIAGEEIARLREGQAVLILQGGTKNSKWLLVITGDNNKTSGWVPEDKIIFY